MMTAEEPGEEHARDGEPRPGDPGKAPINSSGDRSPRRIETDPALNNPDSTPGTGMLPPIGDEHETNIQPSS